MRISIEDFYASPSANVTNLWYENGSFSVQKRNGSLFQIPGNNTDRILRGLSPKQVEQVSKIGYFTIFESQGFSGYYSIKHTCRLLGGGNGPSSESNASNENNSHNDTSYACAHNNRPGVSLADVVEHLGNFQPGSAVRDSIDVLSGVEPIQGVNQAPSSSGSSTENSGSNSSPADTSKVG